MYTAYRLSGMEDNKDGFDTEDDAIEYVVKNHLCEMCEEGGWGSHCAAEWIIVKTGELNECETIGDILEAGGMELE